MKKMIQMKAILMATINLPNGNIFHTDPAPHADIRARYPVLDDEDDVMFVIAKGVAEPFSGDVDEDARGEDGEGEYVDLSDTRLGLEDRAAGGVDLVSTSDKSVDANTGLDTVGSTAHARMPQEDIAKSLRGLPSPDDAPASGGEASAQDADGEKAGATDGAKPAKPPK